MASQGIEMGLVLVLVAMLWNSAAAQSGCTRVLMGLAPCLNFVTGNTSTPSSSCCSQLNSVVQSQPRCLCSLLNGASTSLGITINQTLALSLPGACNVQTPSVSQCNAAANGPTASPITPSAPMGPSADSPTADSPNETPETPTDPSESDTPSRGASSKTVPSTDGTSSGVRTIKSSPHTAVFLLFIIWASTATRVRALDISIRNR